VPAISQRQQHFAALVGLGPKKYEMGDPLWGRPFVFRESDVSQKFGREKLLRFLQTNYPEMLAQNSSRDSRPQSEFDALQLKDSVTTA
jgi:hypothetical protein